LLLLGTALSLNTMLRMVSALLFPLPEGHCKRCAAAAGLTAMAIFLLLHVQATAVLALAWGLLAYGLLGSFAAAQRAFADVLMLSMLRSDYRNGVAPVFRRKDFLAPLIYVVTAPGYGVMYGNRLSAKIAFSLLKHRNYRAAFFLVSDSLSRYPEDFRRWVAEHAAALLIIRLPKDYLPDDEFEDSLRDYYRRSVGQVFLLKLNIRGYTPPAETAEPDEIELSAKLVPLSSDINAQQRVVAAIADEMAMSTFPVAEADDLLPADIKPLIPAIAQVGLQPFANSYLRYRLAQSNVGRFLALLDCVEVLVKCSAVALLTGRWLEGDAEGLQEVPARLSRPSLGHWVETLRQLLLPAGGDQLQQDIQSFWSQPPYEAAWELIDLGNNSEWKWKGVRPRSQIEWLDWFVWLRNVTRGHGVVEEELVSGLWQGLHETCLDMAFGLESLVLSSALFYHTPAEGTTILQGWQRTVVAATGEARPPLSYSAYHVYIGTEAASSPPLLLYPFIISRSGSALVWNGVRKKSVQYLNYGTGEIQQESFEEVDPYLLWERGMRREA
jgi:hypothetical protein